MKRTQFEGLVISYLRSLRDRRRGQRRARAERRARPSRSDRRTGRDRRRRA